MTKIRVIVKEVQYGREKIETILEELYLLGTHASDCRPVEQNKTISLGKGGDTCLSAPSTQG